MGQEGLLGSMWLIHDPTVSIRAWWCILTRDGSDTQKLSQNGIWESKYDIQRFFLKLSKAREGEMGKFGV
jgi:hypothetical protein